MWGGFGFGYTLDRVLSAIADRRDHLTAQLESRESLESGPKTTLPLPTQRCTYGPHTVHYLLDLFHTLIALRELHRVDQERRLIPHVSHGHGSFSE